MVVVTNLQSEEFIFVCQCLRNFREKKTDFKIELGVSQVTQYVTLENYSIALDDSDQDLVGLPLILPLFELNLNLLLKAKTKKLRRK
jgi:hypothetical protein